MKGKLNWQSKEVVNIFDEVNLWSAPFGRIMMENIPMKPNYKVLDIGFGTGFPLIELSQRFGSTSTIYGIDIWDEAIRRTEEKIRILQLENIEIFEQSAEEIPIPDNELDLICSNLGINNFENKRKVLRECFRTLKVAGHLCIATNPIGTFKELFDLFEEILIALNLENSRKEFQKYLSHRDTKESIEAEITNMGFKLSKFETDNTNIRFVNSDALLNHGLIRIGFLETWEKLIPDNQHTHFFNLLMRKIEEKIKRNGEFSISIPILYLEFKKE